MIQKDIINATGLFLQLVPVGWSHAVSVRTTLSASCSDHVVMWLSAICAAHELRDAWGKSVGLVLFRINCQWLYTCMYMWNWYTYMHMYHVKYMRPNFNIVFHTPHVKLCPKPNLIPHFTYFIFTCVAMFFRLKWNMLYNFVLCVSITSQTELIVPVPLQRTTDCVKVCMSTAKSHFTFRFPLQGVLPDLQSVCCVVLSCWKFNRNI